MTLFSTIPDVLEVTLRDGSYLIDFQFTAADTAMIAAALDAVGFRWIEVGHGLGLNASANGKGLSAATDEEYLEAAAQSVKQARWGMFFIPGIGRAEDLRLAARYNMSFVRVGTNITEIEQAQPFITLAKELGMIACYNPMKSYAVSPAEFGQRAALAHSWGADMVYLVDSAGSLYPDDVSAYLRAAQAESPVPLGFHGHDNLSLVMANTLRAIECGAVMTDSSLQGMGRSAGNAITEVLVAILKQRSMLPGVDLKSVMDIGQGLIQPLMRRGGVHPMAITAGYARFHSSFTSKVQRYAQKHHIDVRDLIVRLCKEDQIAAPDDLLERLGQELASESTPQMIAIPAFGLSRPKPANSKDALQSLLKEIRPSAVKANKISALNIVIGDTILDDIIVSGNIQHTPSHIVGSVTLTSEAQLAWTLDLVDGEVDVVLLDVDRKPFGPRSPAALAQQHLQKSLLLTYLDSRVWVDAVEDQVARLLNELFEDQQLVVAGDHPKSRSLALRLVERGARVTIMGDADREQGQAVVAAIHTLATTLDSLSLSYLNRSARSAADQLAAARLVVVWPEGAPWFGAAETRYLAAGAYVLDAGIGSILPDGMDEARRREARIIRINIWPALAGALETAHESARVQRETLGWSDIQGVRIVAGGAMGQRGDIVVDSAHTPTRVIGVADGRGGVLFSYSEEDTDHVRRIVEAINRRLVAPATQ